MPQTFQEAGAGARSTAPGMPQEKTQVDRKRRMAALAFADEATLEAEAARLADAFSYTFLRRPEAGLVMLEGRAGNSGQRFNVGEMLVTRCVVRLEPQGSGTATEGYAFIQGNRPRHAELAALFDALLQQADWAESLDRSLIAPLMARRAATLKKRAEETAPTKVDFFTLARGEDE
ncbi:MAG: phosphonate C-P lyase system protein PhnG [Zoogloeaceae bacterium]|jgi:alpha-D-ribose 1-methylphosphonate 5-triphosphate synthase subunit PhnG|nr:phosphonate C-P lyase system protein PhnG [Zoogloeaceae bacterium]